MMRWLILCCLIVLFKDVLSASDLDRYRTLYESAYIHKSVCRDLITELNQNTPTNVHLAYLGAFQSIWASHVFNPIKKLRTFEKGRANIEHAITLSPHNLEIRLIRYSIQKHCPVFLGYKKNMNEDFSFILHNLHSINSSTLIKLIHQII